MKTMHGVPLYENTASLYCKVGALGELGGKSKHLVSCHLEDACTKNEHCILYVYVVVVHAAVVREGPGQSWEALVHSNANRCYHFT